MDKWQDHANAEGVPEAEPEAPRLSRSQILFAALASAAFCLALFAGLQWWQSGGAVAYRPVAPVQANPVIRKFPTPPTATELVHRDDQAHKAWRASEDLAQQTTVYTGVRGSRYHTATCTALADGKTPMHLGDALRDGYSPCAVCKPEGWGGYIERPDTPAPSQASEVRVPYAAPVQAAPPPMSQREKAMRAAAEHEAAMDADYSQRQNNMPVGAKTTIKHPWWYFPTRLDGGIHTRN